VQPRRRAAGQAAPLGGAGVRYVGVDGCRAGWIAVTRANGMLDYQVFGTMEKLIASYHDAVSIMVDVPIGLPWRDVPIRPCDTMARKTLGRARRSSVFPVPCREATRARTAADARRFNLAELGRSLSQQTWGICEKIAQVDRLLTDAPSLATRLREVHPEVCFWALSGCRPMEHRKSTVEGQSERLRVLARYEPHAARLRQRVLAERRRADVQADDVLDALVALPAAGIPMAARWADAERCDHARGVCTDTHGATERQVRAPAA
jgi:predicted RNase H-like nuclease